MDNWTQLWIKPRPNMSRERMGAIDTHIQGHGGVFYVPPSGDGLPVADADGLYEVRVYGGGGAGFIKFILTEHYHLEIAREVTHTGEEAPDAGH
jgi:hypothetical protein